MPDLYRRRYIPNELTHLKDDVVISWDSETIVTKWKTIRPRSDFDNGVSSYLLKRGMKVNRFMKGEELFLNYIDIGEFEYNGDGSIIFHDLLVDVVVETDGRIRVLDFDQLATALKDGVISVGQACAAMNITASLLEALYSDNFDVIS